MKLDEVNPPSSISNNQSFQIGKMWDDLKLRESFDDVYYKLEKLGLSLSYRMSGMVLANQLKDKDAETINKVVEILQAGLR